MITKRTRNLILSTLFALGLLSPSAFAQLVVPAGLGQMSATQPTRDTAALSGKLLQNGGQNPTVTIRWGDEDRGTDVTPSIAWDNEVTVGTVGVGDFNATVSIPNLEKIYYFRATATNSAGTVVSRQLGVLLPSSPVAKANLLARYDFDGENANDSSGNNRHGTAKKLFSPTEISNLTLWLDGKDSSTVTHVSNVVSQWRDKSGNNNHANQLTSADRPTYNIDRMEFDGSNDTFTFAHGVVPDSTDASMVFLVARCGAASGNDGFISNGRFATTSQSYSYRTNGTSGYSWYSWGNDLAISNAGDNAALQVHAIELSVTGSSVKVYLNGALKGTKTSFTGTANAGSEEGQLGRSNGANESLDGSICEVLIFKKEPNDSERQKVEGYLAHRWGLQNGLASGHPYLAGRPLTTGTPSYITDTPFGTGKAIDLSEDMLRYPLEEPKTSLMAGLSFPYPHG